MVIYVRYCFTYELGGMHPPFSLAFLPVVVYYGYIYITAHMSQ